MPEKAETTHEDVQREAYAAALLREREGYVLRERKDRVAAVDAELKRLGVTRAQTGPAVERAVTKPPERRRKTGT